MIDAGSLPTNLPAKLPAYLPTSLACDFVCPLCQARAQVQFADPTAFAEPEPLPTKNRWAQEQAYREAQTALTKKATKALALVACPACNKRDPQALRRAIGPSLLPVVTLSPMLFMGGVVATSSLYPSGGRYLPVLIGCLLMVLAAPLLARRRYRQIIDEADGATKFLAGA